MAKKDIDIVIDGPLSGHEMAKYVIKYLREVKGEDQKDAAIIAANPEKSKNLETATANIWGQDIDFVQTRTEVYTDKSRVPEVKPASIQEDVLRRDLTINSLLYSIKTGEIKDLTGKGLEDLKNGIIRTPIDPKKTFMDDPLRILRAIRMASRFDFELDPDLIEMAKDPEIQNALRNKVSRERVQKELRGILISANPTKGMRLIKELGLRGEVFQLPEKYEDFDMPQNSPHHQYNVFDHTMEVLSNLQEIMKDRDLSDADKFVLNMASLTHDLGKLSPDIKGTKDLEGKIITTYHGHEEESMRAAEYVLRNLPGVKVEEIEKIKKLIDGARRVNPSRCPTDKTCNMARKTLGRFIREMGEMWEYAIDLGLADTAGHFERQLETHPRTYYETMKEQVRQMGPEQTQKMMPLIRGDEMMKLFNRKGGPWLGTLNRELIDWQLGNPSATKEQAVEFAKNKYQELGLDKMAFISKRSAQELSLYSDPQEKMEYWQKVLQYINENLQKETNPNKIKWLQRKRYEAMMKIQENKGKKPTYEWIDYNMEAERLKQHIQKLEERYKKWQEETLPEEERRQIEEEADEMMVPVEHYLADEIDAMKAQLEEYDKTDEELEAWEKYEEEHGPYSDEIAKREATPPNIDPHDEYWTPQGEVRQYEEMYYDEPKPKALPEPENKELPEKTSSISKRAKKHSSAGIFILAPENIAKQFPSLGKHDSSPTHLTLLFIGKVKKNQYELIENTIKGVLYDQEPFDVLLDNKVSYFPATKYSDGCKVAKMKVISADLHKLHKALKKALKEAGVEIQDNFKGYNPHITIEYMIPPKEKWGGEVPKGSFTIKEVEIWGCGKNRVIPLKNLYRGENNEKLADQTI